MENYAAYVMDAAWIFLISWSVVLLTLSALAFRRDLVPVARGGEASPTAAPGKVVP